MAKTALRGQSFQVYLDCVFDWVAGQKSKTKRSEKGVPHAQYLIWMVPADVRRHDGFW